MQIGSELASNATSFDDTTAPENATSYYIVQCVIDGKASGGSSTVNATTPVAAPTSVVAATTTSTSSGDKTIDLSWTNVSTVADHVKIERSSDNTTWTPIATVLASADTYSDDTGLENVTYTYRVYAVAGATASTHTASNGITTLLSRPTSLAASSPTATTVSLTWTDISALATSYHVERSLDGTNYSDIATLSSGSANSYTDTARTEGTQYWYRVRAVSGSNTSNYSDVQTVTTIPATPTIPDGQPLLDHRDRPELDRRFADQYGLHRRAIHRRRQLDCPVQRPGRHRS